jgi:hypothetical protein
MEKVLGTVSDYLPLYLSWRDDGSLVGEHIDHIGDLRVCLGDVLTVYHTVHSLRDYGWVEHVVSEDEKQLDLELLYNQLRRLVMVLFTMYKGCLEVCERQGERVNVFGIEDVRGKTEFRWLYEHYSQWSVHVMASANWMRKYPLQWLLDATRTWKSEDLFALDDAQRELRLTERLMGMDIVMTLHTSRPLDMSVAMYPDIRYLNNLEMRMRVSGGECVWSSAFGLFPTVVVSK